MGNLWNCFVYLFLLVVEVLLHTVIVKHLFTLKNISNVFQLVHLHDLVLNTLLLPLQVQKNLVHPDPWIMESLTLPHSMGRQCRLGLRMSQRLKSKRVEVLCFFYESIFYCSFNGMRVSLESIVSIFLPFVTLTQHSSNIVTRSFSLVTVLTIFKHPSSSLDFERVPVWAKALIFLFHLS